jgi:EthD domain
MKSEFAVPTARIGDAMVAGTPVKRDDVMAAVYREVENFLMFEPYSTPISSDIPRPFWREVHAPLVEKHRSTLRIARYVQAHSDLGAFSNRLRAFRGSPEPYDGVAEIWYESRQALETLGDDPAVRAASRELLEDERRFVDLFGSPIFLAEEYPIIAAHDGDDGAKAPRR